MRQFRGLKALLYVRSPSYIGEEASYAQQGRKLMVPTPDCSNTVLMDFGYFEEDEQEADLAAAGVNEFGEQRDADTALEIQLLAAKVQAARHCGA